MSFVRFEEFRSFHMQQRDVIDIDAMSATGIALPIADEITAQDADHRAAGTAGENAFLIVEKAAVLDCQVAALRTNAGAVLVRYARPLQGEVAYGDVVTDSDQYRLAAARPVGHDDARAVSSNNDVVLADDCAVEILSRIYLDRIAILRGGHRLARQLEIVTLSHIECSSHQRERPHAHRYRKRYPRHRYHELLTTFARPLFDSFRDAGPTTGWLRSDGQ